MEFNAFLRSLNHDELMFIARLDYGVEAQLHLDALNVLIKNQSGFLTSEQYWFPFEVIALGSNALLTNHEREFAACTLLLLQNIASGYDTTTDVEIKLSDRAEDYDRLPCDLREMVLHAFVQVGC